MTHQSNLLQLNQDCNCFPITRDEVRRSVLSLSDHPDMEMLLSERENYFAATPVFLSAQTVANMREQISTIEQLVKMPAFQNEVFQHSALAAFAPTKSTKGAFMGYDFHITDDGPRLIEINSNAGGAFIVNAIQKAVGQPHQETEALILNMFLREWELSGKSGKLSSIAIIDEKPEDQFHYPDMLLAANILRRYGLNVHITDSQNLDYSRSGVYLGESKIDLVYNRLTDFDISKPKHQALRQAWLDAAIVMTPDPRHHALYANKRNLALLTDREKLEVWGVSHDQKHILSRIPKCVEVTSYNAERLWEQRKHYFFKPFAGFGSRAVYKGAKLTRKTWDHILQGGYVAQEFIRPPVRLVNAGEEYEKLKYDVRVYTYNSQPLLMAARVYQGQVTNLRTAGGGLAPVIVMDVPGSCRS